MQFATVHVPGSNAGMTITDAARSAAAVERNRAAVGWIGEAFAEARRTNAKAVVVVMHASLFEDGPGDEFAGKRLRGGQEGPYLHVATALKEGAAAFGKPVLLIHGDFHEFVVDRPFRIDQGEQKPALIGNVTRLQVFGAPELKAVRVSVEPDTPWVFSFQPLHD